MTGLRDHFLLDPDITYLNHGSYGATPRPVMAAYQRWQLRLERGPVTFLVAELPERIGQVRRVLGSYVGASPEDLVLLPNVTFGVNTLAHSLNLGVGDEILATNHEYGACDLTWERLCRKTGAVYRRCPLPLPLPDEEALVDRFWTAVTPRTRLIFISHLTSSTAQEMPVARLNRMAREAGIPTLIDGAHVPGQIPLKIDDLDPDYYVGNCHKWMCAPKGTAFLYVRKTLQPQIEPLIVSWGMDREVPLNLGTYFQDRLQWWGTMDPSAFLSIPAAIRFQEEHEWERVRQNCHALLRAALEEMEQLTGLPSPYRASSRFYQMAITPLPPLKDPQMLKYRLINDHHIEVPVIEWADVSFLRISVQGYNTRADLEKLLDAMSKLLSNAQSRS